MIVGLGDGENFLASDIAAILAHTRRMVVLDEAEIAEITATSFKITTLDGAPVTRDEIHVDSGHRIGGEGRLPALLRQRDPRAARGAHPRAHRARS